MRVENMPHDQIRFALEIVVNGVAQTGLSPTVAISRNSDGRYWDGAAFTNTTLVALAMTEVNATDQAGLYEYNPSSGFDSYSEALQGYRARFVEATSPVVEHARVYGIRSEMDEVLLSHDTAGTIGDAIRRMLGLRQDNVRVVNSTFHASGKPATGLVLIYDSDTDAAADTTPWALATGKWAFEATYDGSARLTEYLSTRTS